MHVCGLLPLMELLESSGHRKRLISSARDCNTENVSSTADLPLQMTVAISHSNLDKYFLHWLVLMGPTIGLEITTVLYNDISLMNSI